MRVNKLNIVIFFSWIILISCSNDRTQYIDIEYAHYWWYDPDNIPTIKILQYGFINKNGGCQGIIIKRDNKDYFKKFRIDKRELSKFMLAVNSLKHDTIIFNGNMDNPSLIKFVILTESTRRTITFPVHEPCIFANFHNYIDSCFFNTEDDEHYNVELLQKREQFIKDVSMRPDQDGFLNVYNWLLKSNRIDSTSN
jgi:hypothetical protein